jgi:hypothetical protein
MGNVFYIHEYLKKEESINEILASSLKNTIRDLPFDCSDEAREILKLYFYDRSKFKERTTTYLEYQLNVKKRQLTLTLNEIVQIIEAG